LRPGLRLRRLRAVHLMMIVTMLAVPASAFALTGVTTSSAQSTDNQSSPLKLRGTPRHVRFGDVAEITGTAPVGAAGRTLALETAFRRTAPWHLLARTRVGRDGRFRFHAMLRRSGLLRVRPAAAEATAAIAGPAPTGSANLSTSRVRPVTVAAQFRLNRRSHDVLGGSPVAISGKLLPARDGRMVRLQGRTSSGWQTLAQSRTGGRGGFRFRIAPDSGLNRHLRVKFAGDRVNSRALDSAGTVTVYQPAGASWYQDGGSTACGFHAGLGVANRSLPCGTKVKFRYGGRTATAVVDDRGPYVGGRDWDLNQNTAAALGFSGVGTVWTSS
jgi:rare lipoprotein A